MSHVVLTSRSLRDLAKLPKRSSSGLPRILKQLAVDPQHPSLGVRRIRGCGRKRFECRIDRAHRMVLQLDGDIVYVLLADAHDRAYVRAPGAADPGAPVTAAAVGEETPDPGAGEPAGTLFPPASRSRLQAAGVPEDQIDSVLACRTEDALLNLDLPTETLCALIDSLPGVPPGPRVEVDPADTGQSRRVLEGRATLLDARLPEPHRRLLERPHNGPFLVQGSAGCGKTTLAMHLALKDAEPGLFPVDSGAPVLFLCFNNALRRMVARHFQEVLGDAAGRVRVSTVDAWCLDYLDGSGGRPGILTGTEQEGLIRDAVRNVTRRLRGPERRILGLGWEFFREEITEVIAGRVALRWESYRDLARIGRRRPLEKTERRVVWQVYEEYQHLCRAYRAVDWPGLGVLALERLEQDPAPPRHGSVVVDEAQDLTPARLRLCAELAEAGRVTYLADAAQSIYRPAFRWRDIGMSFQGRTAILDANLRQTRQLATWIDHLGSGLGDPEGPEPEGDPPSCPAALRDGPPPTVVRCRNLDAELEFVKGHVARALRSGRRAADILVLALKNRVLGAIRRRLCGDGVPCVTHKEPGEAAFEEGDAVRLLTCHAAKGLDAPVVILVDVNDGTFPPDPASRVHHDDSVARIRSRRVLYVACSRPTEELWLTCTRGAESPFLSGMPPCSFREMLHPVPR